MRRALIVVSQLLVVAALSACPLPTKDKQAKFGLSSKPKASTGDPIAQVGSLVISVEDLEDRINRQSAFTRARYKENSEKQKFLENQVKFEVLALEAQSRGYADENEVQNAVKKIIVQRLTREEFDARLKGGDVTEADMLAYFENNKDKYHKPEAVRLAVISIEKGADAAKAKTLAAQARTEAAAAATIKDRKHFKMLVGKYSSHAETKKTGGDTRYKSRKELDALLAPQVATIGWDLKDINAVSEVIETPAAFWIVKRVGYKREVSRDFTKVKTHIRNTLNREARATAFNAYVDELKAKYNVKVHVEKLDQVTILGGNNPEKKDARLPAGHPPH
ncbi:MAG: hypothetical protein GY822_10310 [Deltaproteobacteria bacterium]|nr:hypothetical protein [Deltaproteobacteria bacterium]